MKSFLPFIALHFLLLSISCTNAEERVAESYENNYPDIIVQEHAEELYDDLKWRLYCIRCDIEVPHLNELINIKDSTDRITFGMLPLKLNYYGIAPTLPGKKMSFTFYYHDKPLGEYSELTNGYMGGVFDEEKDSLMYISTSTNYYKLNSCIDTLDCRYRDVKPLQPEVITYIQNNKNKLAPWFRNEAIKRGVIEP